MRSNLVFWLITALVLTGCSSSGNVSENSQDSFATTLSKSEDLLLELNRVDDVMWIQQGEECFEVCPVLVATPEDIFSGYGEGCVVSAYDSSEYDIQDSRDYWNNIDFDMSGQLLWLIDDGPMFVELMAYSANENCTSSALTALGRSETKQPEFAFGSSPSQQSNDYQVPDTEFIKMPDVTGVSEEVARDWLWRNSYKFNVIQDLSRNNNAQLSVCLQEQGWVIGQNPAPGTLVENSISTQLRLYVDCEWRDFPATPSPHFG